MKNFKFRPSTYNLFAIGILFFVVSCNNEEQPANDSEATTLEEQALQLEIDPDFEKFNALAEEYFNEFSALLVEKGLSEDDLRQMVDNNEESKLDALFGNGSLKTIMSELGPVNSRLEANYGELLAEDSGFDQNSEVESRSSCKARFDSCFRHAVRSYTKCLGPLGLKSPRYSVCNPAYTRLYYYCVEDRRNCEYDQRWN